MMFVLIWVGALKVNINEFSSITGGSYSWNDLYYLLPGAGFEAVVFGVRWLRKYFKTKEDKL
jgi:hypothetical protein